MKRNLENRPIARHLLNCAIAATLALPLPSLAATVALATEPMATSTASNVKPNVMFILDDSGSMDWDYLPDWANSSSNLLRHNSSYNGVYYNPAITYTPPVFYNVDGTLNTATSTPYKYPSQTGQTTATGADATAKPNWISVKRDAYGVQSTSVDNLVGNASFYTIVPGEYCTASDLKTCVAASAPSVTYSYPAPLRWCTTSTIANMAPPTTAGKCQSIRKTGFTNARYPQASTRTITVGGSGGSSISSITVGGQIISAATATATTTSALATSIRDAINNCSATAVAPCTTEGFSATVSGSVVTITANAPGTFTAPTFTPSGPMTYTVGAATSGNSVPGSNRFINIATTTAGYPYPGSTSKAASRSDCAGTTCTYTEEMTNYANWWTYYHTRMQAMKTSVSRAFKSIDNRFRVGFSTISYTGATNGTGFLGNNTFELAHKNSWYTKLLTTATSGSTPLRGALSKAGRYYGNKITGQTDPVQYSCQQNFTILSTDGYWNTNNETSSYTALGMGGALIGNMDGGTTARPMKEGTTAVSNTLADIAKYYYETDLRNFTLWNNCAGGSSIDFPGAGGNPDVCTDNVFTSSTDNNVKQHMTTFTMGLGADGTLNFTSEYDSATSGDFYDLKNGLGTPTVNWPDPIANSAGERIDDLWHAAVNGRGIYFSAKDPDQIIRGFNNALSSITAKLGSAAAAATSTLNPVAGNNYAYVASYTTVKWKGNLEARSININSGLVSDTASWSVEDIAADTCASPNTIVTDTSGSSTINNCVDTNATALTCTSPGVFSGTSTCTTQIAVAHPGTLPPRVGLSTDTRNIYTANDTGSALVPFDATYATAHSTYFDAAHISTLSQWSSFSAAMQTAAVGTNLLNYLRGQKGYEDRAGNTSRLYRAREAVLGDALESQPAYVSNPVFNYTYPDYSTYKTNEAGRAGTVFMGTNDGMMHAFAGDTGEERWAYVPSMVIPNMWKLADTLYSTKHTNLVNGSPIISDVCVSNCTIAASAVWKTILVSGLNGGGRGYFALDITVPATPVLLWEFTPNRLGDIGAIKDNDLGYSFGRPGIARKADGTWVVVVTSGYNNVSPGDGKGYLYVLNAGTGAIISKISTGVGDTVTPSGLANFAIWNDAAGGNQAGYTYGTDLLGNIWRFDINSATVATTGTGSVMKFATLLDSGGTPQPITTAPILGSFNSNPVIFVGTGKYLEYSDLSNTQTQTLYAIKDIGASATWINDPRTHTTAPKMIQQTITLSGNLRTGSKNPVDFNTDLGWFTDFPDVSTGSERVNIASRLVQGTLLVPSIVPSSTVCNPGGYGWLNFFDYSTGWPVDGGVGNTNVSVKYDSPIVGISVIYIKGKPVVEVVTSTDPTPKIPSITIPFDPNSGGSGFKAKRAIWRELIP